MYKYNEFQDSPYDPTELATHSILHSEADPTTKFGDVSEKTFSVEVNLHCIVEENTVAYAEVDCRIIFYPEATTKIGRRKEQFQILRKKSKVHPK